MEMDIRGRRYDTFEDLREYMRGSASAIGVMMCYVMGAECDPATLARASALGEAMQLTNFLRDIGEDLRRGRVYVPAEDLAKFSVTEDDLRAGIVTDGFRDLMRFEIARTRELYAYADSGIRQLPKEVRNAVLLARLLYAQILDQIERQDYDVFSTRARTTLAQKVACAARVAIGSQRILDQLVGCDVAA